MRDEFHISVTGGTVGNVGHTEYHGSVKQNYTPEPHNDAETVQELRKIQDELKEMSGICDELQKALQKNDKSKIHEIAEKFSEGAFGVIGEVVASQIINKIFKL